MIHSRIVYGFVIQTYDDSGKCLGQSFEEGGVDDEWENSADDEQESFGPFREEELCPIELKQPHQIKEEAEADREGKEVI